jgi:hypothetical protein
MSEAMTRAEGIALIGSTWTVILLCLLVRRRRAAIFTPDSFLYRPVFGRLLKVPLKGIKSASMEEPEPSDEIQAPVIKIELLVGPAVKIPIAVSNPKAVVELLNKAARRGLGMATR